MNLEQRLKELEYFQYNPKYMTDKITFYGQFFKFKAKIPRFS